MLTADSVTDPARTGSWLARLDGQGAPHTDTLSQKVAVRPKQGAYTSAAFSFWLNIQTNDPASYASDTLKVQVLNASGTVVKTLHTYSNLDAANGYQRHSFSLNAFLGKTITLKFTGIETLAGHTTIFRIDDAALNAS